MFRRVLAPLALASLLVCCSGETEGQDSGITFELPQIRPDNNPICLNYTPTKLGEQALPNVLLQNLGMRDLVISGSSFVNDDRGHFSVDGLTPTTVVSKDFAVARIRYAPTTTTGYDAVALRIRSNAENYPELDIYIVARAVPTSGVPAPDERPRPAQARDACLERADSGM